jgi:hypothetical protein
VASGSVDLVLLVFVAVCFLVVVCIMLLSYGVVRIIVSVFLFDIVVMCDVKYIFSQLLFRSTTSVV